MGHLEVHKGHSEVHLGHLEIHMGQLEVQMGLLGAHISHSEGSQRPLKSLNSDTWGGSSHLGRENRK